MTAALYDEVVTAAPARKLTVVRDVTPDRRAPAPTKTTRQRDLPIFGVGGDPLVHGAARLLAIPGASRLRSAVACRGPRSPGLVRWPATNQLLQGSKGSPSRRRTSAWRPLGAIGVYIVKFGCPEIFKPPQPPGLSFCAVAPAALQSRYHRPDGFRLASASRRSAALVTLSAGFGHPAGDLAGSVDVLRGEDGAEVRNQRFLVCGRKAPSRTNFEPFNLSCPDRLFDPDPQNQRGNSSLAFLLRWSQRPRGGRPPGRLEILPRG